MRRSAMMVCLMLVASPGRAEIGAAELTFAAVRDCMKEAVGTGSVERDGSVVVLFCGMEKARTLFNFLGKKIRSEIVQDRNGKFENRQFGNNACYHRMEEANGKPADDFRCDLFLVVGDALSDHDMGKQD